MSQPSDVCSFVSASKKVIDNKESSYDLILLENACLRSEISKLSDDFESELKKQADAVESLSLTLARMEGEISEFKVHQAEKIDAYKSTQTESIERMINDQKESFNTYKNSQEEILEQHTEMYTSSLSHYEHWTIGLTLIIALAGLVSLALLSNYKKRETDKLIDNAVDSAKEKLNDDRLVQSAVANAFESEGVINTINNIKIDIINEQEPFIRSIIQDTMASSIETPERVLELQSVLNRNGNDAN